MAKTFEPIATQTASGLTSQYTFSSISGAYTDLFVVINFPTAVASAGALFAQVGNGSVDTGSNYSLTYLYGEGTSATSSRISNSSNGMRLTLATDTTTYANYMTTINFMNYANTTTYKTAISRASQAQSAAEAVVNLWRSTAAINTIKFYQTSNFASGSTFTLYGIKAA
jgi:hypothetical protein